MAYKIVIFHLTTLHYSNYTALHLFCWTIFVQTSRIQHDKAEFRFRGFPKPKSIDFEEMYRNNNPFSS
jgi:hypothetical protein